MSMENNFIMQKSTGTIKLPEREFDSQHRRIWPVKNWLHNPDLIKANLEVSIEVLVELAAEYKVPHYVALDFHSTMGEIKEPTGLLVHFAYLPDGSMVLAYTKETADSKA